MKRILLLIALISVLFLLSSCKKGDGDITYFLACYDTASYVKSDFSSTINTMVKEKVEDWKKDHTLNWPADPGRSQSEQDAEAVQYMEDAYASFSRVAAKLRTDILAVDPNAILAFSWTFEVMRLDRTTTRLPASKPYSKKVEILNGELPQSD